MASQQTQRQLFRQVGLCASFFPYAIGQTLLKSRLSLHHSEDPHSRSPARCTSRCVYGSPYVYVQRLRSPRFRRARVAVIACKQGRASQERYPNSRLQTKPRAAPLARLQATGTTQPATGATCSSFDRVTVFACKHGRATTREAALNSEACLLCFAHRLQATCATLHSPNSTGVTRGLVSIGCEPPLPEELIDKF
jgi:hypothetical protein